MAHYRNDGGGAAMRQLGDNVIVRPQEDIGNGSQYVVLVGAPSPHTFLKPLALEIEREPQHPRHAGVAPRRAHARSFPRRRGSTAPPSGNGCRAARRGRPSRWASFRVRSVEEEIDLGCWYAQYRLPHMAQMPGCIAARKLNCVAGWAKHAILYEFVSLEARMQNFEEPHEALAVDAKEWTGRVVRYTIHTPGSPVVGPRLWPPVE